MRIVSRSIVLLTALICPAALGAQGPAPSPFIDPAIPDGETIVFAAAEGKDAYVMTQRTAQVTENGRAYYEVTSESIRNDYRVRIERSAMAVERSWSRRKKPDLVVESETRIVKNEVSLKPDEALMNDFTGLVPLLRGFPFGRLRVVKLKTSSGGDFTLTVTHTKEVDVKTKAGVVRCHELELGMEGFLGAFVPKSYFWYAKEGSHFLVRFQGQMGGPGSPPYTIELAEMPK